MNSHIGVGRTYPGRARARTTVCASPTSRGSSVDTVVNFAAAAATLRSSSAGEPNERSSSATSVPSCWRRISSPTWRAMSGSFVTCVAAASRDTTSSWVLQVRGSSSTAAGRRSPAIPKVWATPVSPARARTIRRSALVTAPEMSWRGGASPVDPLSNIGRSLRASPHRPLGRTSVPLAHTIRSFALAARPDAYHRGCPGRKNRSSPNWPRCGPRSGRLFGVERRGVVPSTDCPGWTVRDQVSHLIGIERILLGDPSPPAPDPLPGHVSGEVAAMNEASIDAALNPR